MKPRAIIFDLCGDYIRFATGEISLGDMTLLLASFGTEPATVRVNMSRLRKEGWFLTHRRSREAIYVLSGRLQEVLTEGRQRIFRRPEARWDGKWTMVAYQVPEAERAAREQLRKELAWHGFGQAAPSMWMAPRDITETMASLVGKYPAAQIDVLSCKTGSIDRDRELVSRCWDLQQLSIDYQSFITKYSRLGSQEAARAMHGEEAMITRTQIVSDYRRFPFHDPQLAPPLQPEGWLGDEAFALFRRVHGGLAAEANAYVSAILGVPIQQPIDDETLE